MPFLVDCILSAESSGQGSTTYERLFELSREELTEALAEICELDLVGLELCWPNFWVAEAADMYAGALAAWFEAADGTPSNLLKAQLWAQVLGAERFLAARGALLALQAVEIPRTAHALQLDAICVLPDFRGQGVLAALVQAAITDGLQTGNDSFLAEILLLSNNDRACKAYEKLGFRKVNLLESSNPQVFSKLGATGRLQMQRTVNK